MDHEAARCILDLEGRVKALSGVVALLIWVLRQRGVMDADLERRLYSSTSEAVATLPPEIEPAADTLILALQASASQLFTSPASRPDGFCAGD
jgi:hypothetical protein